MSNIIEIDGSSGESGGQIIRTSLTLSAITKKPVHIINIRSGRPNPGLAAQHLSACKAVRSICRGTLTGAELGSSELTFHPGEIVGGKYEFNIGTAGSTTLLAQTILPLLFSASKESTIRIIGGTFIQKSPAYDYFEQVFLPAISNFGTSVSSKLIRAGYYPRGGGEIELIVKPSKLVGCTNWLTDQKIRSIIRLSGLDKLIAIREKKIFVQKDITEVYLREDPFDSLGNCVTAWSGYRGSFVLGQKGKRAEEVASECLDNLIKEKHDVDLHLADQLQIYAILASGPTKYSTSTFSSHFTTNRDIISKFISRKMSTIEKSGLVWID